jgi:hypothetical protein
VLEAFTRIAWERHWLVRCCRPIDVLSKLNNANIALYERGVQSSYKYVTFYANTAWATALLLIGHLYLGQKFISISTAILVTTIAVLLIASHVQWTYYVNYQNKVFGGGK